MGKDHKQSQLLASLQLPAHLRFQGACAAYAYCLAPSWNFPNFDSRVAGEVTAVTSCSAGGAGYTAMPFRCLKDSCRCVNEVSTLDVRLYEEAVAVRGSGKRFCVNCGMSSYVHPPGTSQTRRQGTNGRGSRKGEAAPRTGPQGPGGAEAEYAPKTPPKERRP